MYRIGGEVSESAVFVKLHRNGCYVPCPREEAEGVCVKVARTHQTDGKSVTVLEDVVYRLGGNALTGTEPSGTLETTEGALELADSAEALRLLGYKEV